MERMVIKAILLRERVRQALSSEKGQGMVEYGLILAGIAVVCMAAYYSIGTDMKAKLDQIVNQL